MELDEQPPTDKSNLGGKNKEMHMKRILIIGGTAALLLNNEILTMTVLTIAAACAVAALFQAMAERGERF